MADEEQKPNTKKTDREILEMILATLGGDAFTRKPGLIQVVDKLVEDFYNKETGAQKEIERMKALVQYMKGWIAAACLFFGVLGWLIGTFKH